MKTIIKKAFLILLSLIVSLTIGCNAYMFFITYKLSECKGIFDSIGIVSKYKLFENIGIGAFSLSLTIVLLLVLFTFIVKEFFKKK
jgi:hypothetical protein